MAGNKDSPSRLGTSLGGYDQIIALSQANINESLEYHFTAKPELCEIDIALDTPSSDCLSGTLLPPTVELIDLENADQALYVLRFESGAYEFLKTERKPKGGGFNVTPISIPMKGWRLAFYVDFSLKRMTQIPAHIVAKIQNPGVYSVDQLLVDFGTADTLNFNWDKSTVTGIDEKYNISAKATITNLVTKWIETLKADPAGSHNVVGYALTVKADGTGQNLNEILQKVSPAAPSFPPTSVRLQTINYRPGGDASQSRTDHDFNAFIFTEMTGTNQHAKDVKDLAWSGDLFYESIGGTLIMSRKLFWDGFMRQKVADVSDELMQASFDAGGKQWKSKYGATREMYTIASSSDWQTDGLKSTRTKTGGWRDASWNGQGIQLSQTVTITTEFAPHPGTGQITMNSTIGFVERGLVQRPDMVITSGLAWKETINLKSIDGTGQLTVELQRKVVEKTGDAQADDSLVNSVSEWYGQSGVMASIKSKLEAALVVQNNFVFPGGGDFEMKDPIFNNAGDLMIGLTYKKGDAAK